MLGNTLYILKPFWVPNLIKIDENGTSLGDRRQSQFWSGSVVDILSIVSL